MYSKNKEVQTESDKVNQMKDGMNVANYKQENITVQNSLEATISSLATQMMVNKKLDTSKAINCNFFCKIRSIQNNFRVWKSCW